MQIIHLNLYFILSNNKQMPYILAKKYSLLKTIGEGASSFVKLAIELDTGTHVAIKIMNSSVDENL